MWPDLKIFFHVISAYLACLLEELWLEIEPKYQQGNKLYVVEISGTEGHHFLSDLVFSDPT